VVALPTGYQCPDFATKIAAIGNFENVCEVTGTLTNNATFSNEVLWVLTGRVAVGNDRADSAELTVEAGTTVIGLIMSMYLNNLRN
jgi:trimeric autotransporter adhesin